ncbi:MAG: 4Fe-4S binding protein [Anaerolineaceae bacterium]
MPETKIKQKLESRWVIARKITQGLSFIVFFLAVVFSRQNGLPANLVDFTIRLSPLAMLSHLFSSKTFLAGSALSLILLLSSLVVGRAWCGWLCPLGTILDLIRFSKIKNRYQPPENLRKIKYGLLIIILLSALFGNLTLLFFDPLTIFIRSTSLTILPAMDRSIFAVEKMLIKIPFLAEPVFTFDGWLRPAILPSSAPSIQYALLVGLFFIAIILLNLVAERFWCRYICPLGALLGLPSRLAVFQRRTKASCSECGLCSNDCPTDTINPQKNYLSDPSECTLCMNCLQSCQKNSLSFSPHWQPAVRQPYDLNRRQFLTSMGISIFSVALLSVDWIKRQARSFRLRAPGVNDEKEFLSKCIRCGICIKICPTQALQPDFSESGFEGAWTPVLVPRNGFCDFGCNACGQNCPVQAIPPLSLEEKRETLIGHAYIDHNRCLAWSDHINCIVCEEMCPIPQKAISLETGQFTLLDGSQVEISLPVVDRERCIGCGTCENKCPVQGDSAIRVYTL